MGNILNYNFNKLNLKLSNSDYWDFYLASDDSLYLPNTSLLSGSCAVVWYDFNNTNIFPNNINTGRTIYSLLSWTGSTNTGYTMSTIGLTGIDNGLVTFKKDSSDPTNLNLLSALTGTTLVILSGDNRMVMTQVTGTTGNFVYPIEDATDISGDYKQLCGGFYQGYYKLDGTTYEVLPSRYNGSWSAEFWLKPQDICSPTTGTTLNDEYSSNSGFFFYMGSRAENKFWNQFEGSNTGCLSGCVPTTSACTGSVSTFCTTIKEKDVTVIGEYGFAIPLNPPQVKIEVVTNPFLIYGRAIDVRVETLTGNVGTLIFSGINNTSNTNACENDLMSHDGLGAQTICSYDGNGIAIAKTKEIINDYTNPFLIYGRGAGLTGCSCSVCCGPEDGYGNKTICLYSGKTISETQLDYNLDIHDNALGFRIKNDGSIGYRLLTMSGTCYTANTGERLYQSGVTIQEKYSSAGVVNQDVWNQIVIRFVCDNKEGCELTTSKQRNGKLMIYVNSKLKLVEDNFPEFIARRLEEHYTKQLGVPFNFSIGGGSQGLLESQTFDGLDMDDRGLPIETYFAGSFIGGISQFKFNICDLDYRKIKHNYQTNAVRYGL